MSNKFNNDLKPKKMSNKNKPLSMEQKIKLIEEYLNDPNTNGPIVQSTQYKGYKIGSMVAQLRSEINRELNKNVITPQVIKKLNKLGLLGKKIEASQEEKVQKLSEFCKNYSSIWLLRKNEKIAKYIEYAYGDQSNKINKELDRAQRYYSYLYSRFYRGKLSEEQKETLRQSKVR